MICPYCWYDCGALENHPELGPICPTCRDKFLKTPPADKCSVCGANIADSEFKIKTSTGHTYCWPCICEARRRMEKKKGAGE